MIDILILKIIVSVAFVVGLSIIVDKVSPRVAGILAGYPTGSAITLFFFGLENGAEFASRSSLFNVAGLIAMQTFIYIYYRASIKLNLFFSSLIALTGYLVVVSIIKASGISGILPIVISALSIPVFLYLFKPIENIKVNNRVDLSGKILFIRAVIASSIILLITGIANGIGSTWAGLFSAFPVTLFPLIIIVHLTYDAKHVHTVIKNVPLGIPSLLLYSLTVFIAYPAIGIYFGTVAAYAVATTYLVIYRRLSNRYSKL